MSKTIYIGGRLESKEKGNVVTGANAILDDTKGKKQNVINKETDDELLRLEQSKQDNLNFDNAPTENSTNPVTSGGVYTAEKALSDAIEAILLLIPSAATALNKLVDTNTMNSSISTASATFRGTYNAVSDLGLTYQATHAQIEAALDALGLTADNNDFAFVQIPVSDQSQDIAKTERFKFNGTNWLFEYDLNTSGYTAAQWAAINSGITVALVTKLTDLPTAAALQLALNGKQDTLTFDTEPTALSQNPVTSGGIYLAIQAVATALSNYSDTTDNRLNTLEGLVPTEASSSNKLTDKAYVDGLIQAITELIPAEADTTNQLADKAYVLAQILAATPAFKGQYTTLAELQAVASPKDGDLGIVRTKDSDGMDVFTVYQYLNNAWNVFYSLSYHPQTKPATTGTTGDYPYNGMGRVELAKNMVNTGTDLEPVMVNTLTQDMFYKGAVGSRVPNTNTIFVLRYDYVLAENITIPDGCVLEFDGGSISDDGTHTINFNNCIIEANHKIFTNVTPYADCTIGTNIKAAWFGVVDDGVTDNSSIITYINSFCNALAKTTLPKGTPLPITTVEFDVEGKIAISTPVTFNQVSITGFPTFYYTGSSADVAGAVNITNLQNGIIEINVISSNFVTLPVDLSDGNKFGGICMTAVAYSRITANIVAGFFAAVLFNSTSGNNSSYYNTIRVNQGIGILHLCYVYNTNSGWSNGNRLLGSCFSGMSEITLPSGVEYGGLFTIAGDSSYGMNGLRIEDCNIEGTGGTANCPVLNNEQTTSVECVINNIRLEAYGDIVIKTKSHISCKTNLGIGSIKYDGLLNDTSLLITSTLAKMLGVHSTITEDAGYKLLAKFIPDSKKNSDKLYNYDFDIARIHISNLSPNEGDNYGFTIGMKIASKQIIGFSIDSPAGMRISSIPVSTYENAISNGTVITKDTTKFSQKGIIYTGNLREDEGDIYINTANTKTTVLYNSSDNDYYIYFYCQMGIDYNVIITSPSNIVFAQRLRGGFPIIGTTSERPSLANTFGNGNRYIGYEYIDTSLGNKHIWFTNTGSTGWVDATGTNV